MTNAHPTKLTIVGAGSVGASLAYAALIRGTAHDIVLTDVNEKKVNAEVLDLAHGTPFIGPSHITGGTDLALTENSDVIVITAGAKQEPGQSRLDLAATNIRILENLLPELQKRSPDAVFMLVTNPCDILTVHAHRITGLPAGRVFSSGTVLDSARLRWLIAEAAGVDTANVHALILGEHGDSEFPYWSGATIGQIPIRDWTTTSGNHLFTRDALEHLTTDVARAAYRIIEGKGATNYAIGLSGARIIEAILRNEQAILPVSTVLTDYHGITGIALSVPSIVGAGGTQRVLDIPFDAHELAKLHSSADTLAETLTSF